MNRVSRVLLSTVLDEIYLLRAGCAYEAAANRVTTSMRVPQRLAATLDEINSSLLAPAARGQAHALFPAKKVKVERRTWEALHAFGERYLHQLSENTVPEDLYLAALDETAALRGVLRTAAERQRGALLFKTLPSSRRAVVEGQVDRMNAAAAGDLSGYRAVAHRVLLHSMREVGACDLLTTSDFESELSRRKALR